MATETTQQSHSAFLQSLKKYYTFYTGGFVAFVVLVGILEQMGVPNKILGYIFLFFTIALYAGIGFMSKTADLGEYYVAGRRVPALFNGMATGADWMSAASFIGMAGTLYLSGYDGLAFVLGWTGGYCLVAIFLAPYLRKFGQFTIPDFLGARFGGHTPRFIGVVAAIVCSFTYVIAQIYGVGLITSRFTGLEFQVGVFVGLAGILVCSFLGGMKAVTWTQVAQYIILIFAYMIPVVWLAVKQTGIPIPQIVAYTHQMPKIAALEKEFNDKASPKGAKEESVRAIFRDRAAAASAKLAGLEKDGAGFLATEKQALVDKVNALKAATEPAADPKAIEAAEKSLKAFPVDAVAAKKAWTAEKGLAARAAPVKPHAEAFAAGGKTPEEIEKNRTKAKKNFLALIMCLMVGTAALPHILMRYYTTPSVHEARVSVFWGLFFIFLLYFTA
ncbi:MAG: VC_2705 family sodium/solute symporter, partial [Sulfuritalea sp.]|nr:VC_2705 family sodium/solute symporter [Sulfuritalea sp.]